MGSPASDEGRESNEWLHRVELTKGFWLADTACTQALWELVMGNNPSSTFFRGSDRPVHNVSWVDCAEFLERLSFLVRGLTPTFPTEAQWEYACRSGTTTPFNFGPSAASQYLNCASEDLYRKKILDVKSLPPNSWGLYEMHGNVWEWCLDCLAANASDVSTDPVYIDDNNPSSVFRGGGWDNLPQHCRSAIRAGAERSYKNFNLGFRIAYCPVWSFQE